MNALGLAVGSLIAPVTGAVSRMRHARMFHPDGIIYEARVTSIAEADDLAEVAERLSGTAIVRLSSAWWKNDKEWPDVLGLAIRFVRSDRALSVEPIADDQDLLLATVRFPWTTPFAPLATNVHSFLFNHFHAVSPFDVDGVGRVKLRLRSPRLANRTDASRRDHLAHAVVDGRARYVLEARRLSRSPFKRTWEPIARIDLTERVKLDGEALRFSPFHEGRGLHPRGFVHALRAGTYDASQQNRPASAGSNVLRSAGSVPRIAH